MQVQERYLSIRELALLLGCCEMTIRRALKEGKLEGWTAIRVGRMWRFQRKEQAQ